MDLNEVGEVLSEAVERLGESRVSTTPHDFETELRSKVFRQIEVGGLYVVAKVAIVRNVGRGKKSVESMTVSGSLLRLSNWLSDMKKQSDIRKIVPMVKSISSDRNWTRKQADEV